VTKLYLRSPFMDKNFMLIMESDDSALLAEFRGQGFATLPKSLRPFLQIDGATCKGWEFWSSDQDAILDACVLFARHLKLLGDLEIR
jgi:hypothetical protein